MKMKKSDLLGEKWAYNSIEATARIIITLNLHFRVKNLGWDGRGSVIVELPFCNNMTRTDDAPKWNSGEWWVLSDNGGEINVEPINHPERMRSIPSTSDRAVLTAETMAWRLWCAMTNQEIDWDWNDQPAAHVDIEPLKIERKY